MRPCSGAVSDIGTRPMQGLVGEHDILPGAVEAETQEVPPTAVESHPARDALASHSKREKKGDLQFSCAGSRAALVSSVLR